MTDHVVRLYATAGALIAFFVAWAGIAARPWVESPRDPRVVALDRREQRLQRDAALVRQLVESRSAAPAAESSVRIVTLPPVTTTRSS